MTPATILRGCGVGTAHLPQDDFTEDVAVRPDGTILLSNHIAVTWVKMPSAHISP